MDDALILESSYLIDLEREQARGVRGPAHDVLDLHPHHRLFTTPTVAGELASGRSMRERVRWESLLQPFRVLPISADVCWRYGQAFRYLRENGLLIGANDLWIAATGLAYDVPVVTRDVRDFRRVPGLEVVGYG